MFRKTALVVLGMSTYLTSNIALAENQYVGGSLAFAEYSEDGVDDDASLNVLIGRFGTYLNENFAVEARLGMGVGDDSVSASNGTDDVSIDLELDHMYGLYIRAGQQVENFYPYAVAGMTKGKLSLSAKVNNSSVSISDSASGFSYGFGTDFDLGNNLALNFEYMNYIEKDDYQFDAFSFGIISKF
ncbi:porin family protein [Marinomonas sp. A79]|uniref:Porin family protein n=1 Tax=Marinomonas vulgaris TaxID=2823372 RepID=A0ABS5HEQ2_9GAMM|nr:outer membrane beta-barrel protein [Marinomonas vulgaris]MBR7890108.1 porin family protein [Marinomonas vulgaris]